MGQSLNYLLDKRFQFPYRPNLEEMQSKKQGKHLRIRNLTGHDALFAVYKVMQPPCVSTNDCTVDRSVRHSARVFIAQDDNQQYFDLYYKPMDAVERTIPGIRLFLYWVLLPKYNPNDPKPSLYSMAFAVEREVGRTSGNPFAINGMLQPTDILRVLDILVKYWPTIRESAYINTEFEPLRLAGFAPPRPRRIIFRPLPLVRRPFVRGRRPRMGGRGCESSDDCANLGYGDVCVNGQCACRADKECTGIGFVCGKNMLKSPINDPTTQQPLGMCQIRESCGVGRFCPVGFTCNGTVSGKCERDVGEFGATSVAKACLRHPKICYRLGKDSLDLWRTTDLRKKGGPGPKTLRKLEDLTLNLIILFLEDTHSVRDLIVRLNLDERWLGCAGVSLADIGDPNRFEAALFMYLEIVAQIPRTQIQTFQREIHRAPDTKTKDKIRADFKQVLRKKFYDLKKQLRECNRKGLFRNRGRCKELADFAQKTFQKCPIFTDFANPDEAYISKQVAADARQLINENLLPNNLRNIPEAVVTEMAKKPKKYKEMRLATMNGLTKIRVDGLTASSTIDVPFITQSRFLKTPRLATDDEMKKARYAQITG